MTAITILSEIAALWFLILILGWTFSGTAWTSAQWFDLLRAAIWCAVSSSSFYFLARKLNPIFERKHKEGAEE